MKKNIKLIMILFIIFFSIFMLNYNVVASELALEVGHYNTFKGKIAKKYPVEMFLYYNKSGEIIGDYFYTEYQSKIKLKGNTNKNQIVLFEYNEAGKKTAKFTGNIRNKKFSGTWYSFEKNKQYNFELKLTGHFWGTAESIYADAGLDNEEEVEEFAKNLKKNILNNNKREVAKVIDYPIEVEIEGEDQIVKNKEKFIKKFDKIFYQEYVKTLEDISTINMDTHYTSGVMFGNQGQIWFKKPWEETNLQVTTINNPTEIYKPNIKEKNFIGRIGDKGNIHMKLKINYDKSRITGSYYYDKDGNEIEVEGWIDSDNNLVIKKYKTNSKLKVMFNGKYIEQQRIVGHHYSSLTAKENPFVLIEVSDPKIDIDKLFYDNWRINKDVTSKGNIVALTNEEVDNLIDTNIIYNQNLFRYDYEENDGYKVSKPNYKVIGIDTLDRSRLGIYRNYVIEVNIYDDTGKNLSGPGSVFWIKNKNTIYISHDGVCFELKRENRLN